MIQLTAYVLVYAKFFCKEIYDRFHCSRSYNIAFQKFKKRWFKLFLLIKIVFYTNRKIFQFFAKSNNRITLSVDLFSKSRFIARKPSWASPWVCRIWASELRAESRSATNPLHLTSRACSSLARRVFSFENI